MRCASAGTCTISELPPHCALVGRWLTCISRTTHPAFCRFPALAPAIWVVGVIIGVTPYGPVDRSRNHWTLITAAATATAAVDRIRRTARVRRVRPSTPVARAERWSAALPASLAFTTVCRTRPAASPIGNTGFWRSGWMLECALTAKRPRWGARSRSLTRPFGPRAWSTS